MIRRWLKKRRLLNAERRYRKRMRKIQSTFYCLYNVKLKENEILEAMPKIYEMARATTISIDDFRKNIENLKGVIVTGTTV